MPPSKTRAWFQSHVLKPRLLAAYIWGSVLVPPCGGAALALLGASFYTIFSLALYRLLFWATISVCLLAVLSLHHARVVPRVHSHRLAVLLALLRPTLLFSVFLQSLLGSIVANSLVGVASPAFEALVFRLDFVDTDSFALHEGAVFVGCAGAFVAAVAALRDVLMNKNMIVFPTLRLGKFLHFRQAVHALVATSAREGWVFLKWFFILYYLVGGFVKNCVCLTLMSRAVCPQRKDDPGGVPMNSVWGLFQLGVLWNTYISAVFILFSRRLVVNLVVAYIVEPSTFPILNAIKNSEDGQPTLEDALNADDAPLAQLLSFEHLSRLAKDGDKARKPFFSLSQPGGHPHTWNNISAACINHLNELLKNIAACNASVNHSNNNASGGKLASNPIFFSRLAPIRYLLTEYPGARARKVFVEARKSIWAVESLSDLVAASFDEDDFGVVQKKLASILELLVGLHDAVEKNVKMFPGAPVSRSISTQRESGDVAMEMRPAFKSAVKTAIYRVVVKFGSHLFSIQGLSADTSKRLKNFVEIRE